MFEFSLLVIFNEIQNSFVKNTFEAKKPSYFNFS